MRTARVPGVEDQYLINPYGLLFDEICASNLLKVDFDGNVILGDYPFNGYPVVRIAGIRRKRRFNSEWRIQ